MFNCANTDASGVGLVLVDGKVTNIYVTGQLPKSGE